MLQEHRTIIMFLKPRWFPAALVIVPLFLAATAFPQAGSVTQVSALPDAPSATLAMLDAQPDADAESHRLLVRAGDQVEAGTPLLLISPEEEAAA